MIFVMHRLTWKSFAPNHEAFCVARQHFIYRRRPFMHYHDYAEVFWIESEEGYHLINGQRLPLAPGDLFMIRPEDRHDLRAIHENGLMLVNISFPAATIDFLRQRYFQHDKTFWGGREPTPAHFKLSNHQLECLKGEIEALARAPRERIYIERFLLNLLHELFIPSIQWDYVGIPQWLRHACEQIRFPEHFSRGTQWFAKLAKRCPEHVARVTKEILGKTPTQIVNEARLDYAAEQLSLTSNEIIQICYDCGFESLSHFYKVFRKRFHIPPRGYRRQQQSFILR